MITIEWLKERAEFELQFAVKQLRTTGELAQAFRLFASDGSVSIVVADASVTNSGRGKAALADRVRHLIVKENAVAVMMVSDVFLGDMTDDQKKIMQRLNLNVTQAAAMGLCTKQEAVIVTLDSPLYKATLVQVYQRKGNRITLGERRDSGDGAEFSGQFMSFFPSEAAKA